VGGIIQESRAALSRYTRAASSESALLLTKDERHADDNRLRIARDYWRALDRADAQS
jgi:hypothetical protein